MHFKFKAIKRPGGSGVVDAAFNGSRTNREALFTEFQRLHPAAMGVKVMTAVGQACPVQQRFDPGRTHRIAPEAERLRYHQPISFLRMVQRQLAHANP